ncbi:MAG: ROK family protein [Lysobacteraceae bacterium]|nr:MAG: ROK family protein [Xanthomonadaceae bacterium]
MENDANTAALAEYYVGGLMRRCSTAVVILLGHGIGAGIIVEDRILRGAMASAGEIGWLYPTSEPRPSTLDLLSTLRDEGCAIRSLVDFDAVTAEYEEVVDRWVRRAAKQIEPIINWGVAWIDPGEFAISSPLPAPILQSLVDHIDFGAMHIGDHCSEVPRVSVSTLQGSAATIGAALLPIHATAWCSGASNELRFVICDEPISAGSASKSNVGRKALTSRPGTATAALRIAA